MDYDKLSDEQIDFLEGECSHLPTWKVDELAQHLLGTEHDFIVQDQPETDFVVCAIGGESIICINKAKAEGFDELPFTREEVNCLSRKTIGAKTVADLAKHFVLGHHTWADGSNVNHLTCITCNLEENQVSVRLAEGGFTSFEDTWSVSGY